MLVEKWRHHHLGRYGFVSIPYRNRKTVIVNGDALVWVSSDDRELHVGGDEWRCRAVELVDGDADDLELRVVGAVD